MSKEEGAREGHEPENGHGKPHSRLVEVTIDGAKREIPSGRYVVSELKKVLSVPADYELDRVVGREIKALSDDQAIEVHKGEVFVSHVRRGGSS